MSRASTPKSGHRHSASASAAPSPVHSFSADEFLQSHNLDRHISNMLQALLHYRPADPLLFVRDYLRALAREEDEHFHPSSSMAAPGTASPRVGSGTRRKGGKDQAGNSSKGQGGGAANSSLPQGGFGLSKKIGLLSASASSRAGITSVQFMKLKMELERYSYTDRGRKHGNRLHELLAEVFLCLSKNGGEAGRGGCGGLSNLSIVNAASVDDVALLLRNLAEELRVPRRAIDQLVGELESVVNKGRVTFAQFCGAARSLAMLPGFLEEAERYVGHFLTTLFSVCVLAFMRMLCTLSVFANCADDP